MPRTSNATAAPQTSYHSELSAKGHFAFASSSLPKARHAPLFLAASCGVALLGGALFVPAHAAGDNEPAPQVTRFGHSTEIRITGAGRDGKARVLLAQANNQTNPQADNNQPNQPAASPEAKTQPEGLTIPIGPDKSGDQSGDTGPRSGGSTLPRPGGSSLPVPGGAGAAPTLPALPPVTQGGPSAETVAAAEGREVASVRVVGLRVIPEESVLLQATNTRRGAAFSARQAELDRAKIAAMGFFASVQYQVTPNLEDPTKVDVAFVVAENRVLTGFKINGNTSVPAEELLKVTQSKTGAVLNSNTINDDIGRIQELYRSRGFAALVTDFKQEENGQVTLTIQEAKVSRIVFTGLKKTNEALIRKLIRTKPGDAFDQKRLQTDLNSIYDTGFFEDVTYKLDDDPDNPGTLIVTIGVKEKRTGTFTLGVGFDSRSKLSGFVTVAETNFRGSGQRVAGSVELGAQRTFDISYGNPFVGRNNASYNTSIYSRRIYREPSLGRIFDPGATEDDLFEERRVGGRLDYTMPLNRARTSSLLFGFRNERASFLRTDFVDDPDDPDDDPVVVRQTGRIVAPSFGYLRDKRDLRLDPSRGGREQIIVEKALSVLGGQSNFTKVDLDLRRYLPLMKGAKPTDQPKLVLAGRFVLGKSFGQLPAFEQYFVGGSETVRGYDTDEQFGDNQVFGNLELRYRLQRKFQIVGFLDAGRAFGGEFTSDTPTNPEGGDLLFGIGAGIRVQTPIGPIRLDIGRGRDGVRTHFGIGAAF